jgi:hypothetical protein
MSETTFGAPSGDPPDNTPAITPPTPPQIVFADPLIGEKITLPSGGWALFRDVTKLRSKHQKLIMRAGARAQDTARGPEAGGIERGWATTEALLTFLILSWSLPYEPDPDNPAREWILPSADPTISGRPHRRGPRDAHGCACTSPQDPLPQVGHS